MYNLSGIGKDSLLSMARTQIIYINAEEAEGWMEDMLEADYVEVSVHYRAKFKGRGVLNGCMYSGEKERDSSHGSVAY